MKSSIYISSEKIEVIGYSGNGRRVSVKEYLTLPLPEGSMINGKIIDSAYMTECLESMRRKRPALFAEPALIVDGNSIFSKRIAAPKLNKWQYIQFIQNEFADTAQNIDELVCDYQRLGKSGGAQASLFVCAADRAQVEMYISTFRDAGIKLASIRIGAQAIQSYVSSKYELQRKTFVLNVIDGLTLFSMIFDNGVNIFMSRTRLYSEDKQGFIQSLIENLSGLIQFNRSQKFNDIAASYYLGLDPEDLQALSSISPYPDIEFSSLDIFGKSKKTANLPGDAHFAYLNALLGSGSIDLIRGCKMLEELKKRQRPKMWIIPALVCVMLALAVPAVYLFARIYGLDNNIAEINRYLKSPEVSAKSAELDSIHSETAHYVSVISQLESKIKTDSGKAAVTNKILDLVTGTHSGVVSISQFSFDEDTGILSINGSSASETDSAKYVDALKAGGLVKDVRYTGYSYNSQGEYNFSIELTLFTAEVAE